MDDSTSVILKVLEQCAHSDSFPWDDLTALERRADLPAHLASAIHALHHFADDADIRARDPEYAAYWKGRLAEIRDDITRTP